MKIITKNITRGELKAMAKNMFDDLVKAVVDIKKEIMAVDAPMHADEEAAMIKDGSKQENLWGINLYPDQSGADFIEFDSMINIKPGQNNRSRDIHNTKTRQTIIKIVHKRVVVK